jgi:hypothetical protein
MRFQFNYAFPPKFPYLMRTLPRLRRRRRNISHGLGYRPPYCCLVLMCDDFAQRREL